MKKNAIKSAFAIACVVAASVSGFKAYDQHNKNVAAANMLLAENVEALSSGDGWSWGVVVDFFSDLFSGGDTWYQTRCNEPCQFYKNVNGEDILVDGTRIGCENTRAKTAGCNIPNYNPCRQ